MKELKNYIKKGTLYDKEVLTKRYHQNFLLKLSIETNQAAITMLYINGELDDKCLQLAEFMYKCEFLTYEQIVRYARMNNIEDIDNRLKTMIKNYIFNKFCMSEGRGQLKEIPDDAQIFYCLHNGGKVLLEHYSKFPSICWDPGHTALSSSRVLKKTAVNEITLSLLANEDVEGLEMEPNPRYRNAGTGDIFTGQNSYKIKVKDGADRYLLVDTVFGWEDESNIRNRINFYTYLITSRAWKKYYHRSETPPDLIVLTDSDETAVDAIDYMVDCAKSETNMSKTGSKMGKAEIAAFTTPARLKNGLFTDDSLIGYDAELNGAAKFPFTVK